MVELLGQLQELKTQRVKQKVKLKELEEQLAVVIQVRERFILNIYYTHNNSKNAFPFSDCYSINYEN